MNETSQSVFTDARRTFLSGSRFERRELHGLVAKERRQQLGVSFIGCFQSGTVVTLQLIHLDD